MVHVDGGSILANLILGILAVISGVLIVRHRRRLNDSVFKAQELMLGRRIARVSAGRQTPFMMGLVGLSFVLVGLFGVSMAAIGTAQVFLS